MCVFLFPHNSAVSRHKPPGTLLLPSRNRLVLTIPENDVPPPQCVRSSTLQAFQRKDVKCKCWRFRANSPASPAQGCPKISFVFSKTPRFLRVEIFSQQEASVRWGVKLPTPVFFFLLPLSTRLRLRFPGPSKFSPPPPPRSSRNSPPSCFPRKPISGNPSFLEGSLFQPVDGRFFRGVRHELRLVNSLSLFVNQNLSPVFLFATGDDRFRHASPRENALLQPDCG